MASFKYGLNIQPKKNKGPASPKRKRLFDDDDEEDDAGVPPPPTKKTLNLASKLSAKKHDDKATALDSSIYDYDASWEAQNSAREAKKAADKADALERKPKYMNALLASAEVRKRDQLRAKDRLLQRERDEEGDEFKDKESFVTGAYKAQQEEVRRAEEEERKREEEEAKRGGGLGRLYRSMLDAGDKEHAAIVKAGNEGVKARPNSEKQEEEDKPQNVKAGVAVNEDGEVVDKRQLLTAGLNIGKKPVASEAPKAAASKRPERENWRSKNNMRDAARERQTRLMEAQLEEAAKRAEEQEAEERKKMQQEAQSKKSQGDVQSAKERYLARKKAAAEGKS